MKGWQRNGLWIIALGGVVGTLLAARLAAADAPKEELAKCKASLSTCTSRLGTCRTDLAACEAQAVCGNGVVETGEDCDVGTLNGKTCQTEGFAGGTLACGTGCAFDTIACFATRFEDNGDGTITDNQTGLMWEKKSNDSSVHDVNNTYSWGLGSYGPTGTAFTDFLGTLNNCVSSDGSTVTGGFAGHCDWRLPTLAELRSIIDTSHSPTVDPVFNTACASGCTVTSCSCTVADYYWSSVTEAPEDAWAVNFFNDFVADAGKSSSRRVRAVRGGQ
jgi:uncharacterized protein DUF1566